MSLYAQLFFFLFFLSSWGPELSMAEGNVSLHFLQENRINTFAYSCLRGGENLGWGFLYMIYCGVRVMDGL
jgi:hypothetical protein